MVVVFTYFSHVFFLLHQGIRIQEEVEGKISFHSGHMAVQCAFSVGKQYDCRISMSADDSVKCMCDVTVMIVTYGCV